METDLPEENTTPNESTESGAHMLESSGSITRRDETPEPSKAYAAFAAGNYPLAAALIEDGATSSEDPIDVAEALTLDPAIPITGTILGLIWASVALSVI